MSKFISLKSNTLSSLRVLRALRGKNVTRGQPEATKKYWNYYTAPPEPAEAELDRTSVC
jgi:hypothetical protein